MFDDLAAKREFVASLYPGPRWKRKVSRMPDNQVLAIFFREKKKAEEAEAQKKKESSDGGSDIPF